MNISMPNPVKSFGYINCYRASNSRTVNNPTSSITYNCHKIFSWSRRPKTIPEIRKKFRFLQVINKSIIYKFFKYFTNHRKKGNNAVVFSCRPFPNILKRQEPLMIPSSNLENKTSSDTYWTFQLICMNVQDYSSLEPLLWYNQDQEALMN